MGFVDEIQRDLLEREIRIADGSGEQDAAVAVLAGERAGAVGIDFELPALKVLGGQQLVETLRQGNVINQPPCLAPPRSATYLAPLNRMHHHVTVPVLAARELPQAGLDECLRIGLGSFSLAWRAARLRLVRRRGPGPLDEGSNAARQRAALRGGAAQIPVRKRAALIPRRDRAQVLHERPDFVGCSKGTAQEKQKQFSDGLDGRLEVESTRHQLMSRIPAPKRLA